MVAIARTFLLRLRQMLLANGQTPPAGDAQIFGQFPGDQTAPSVLGLSPGAGLVENSEKI
jgi:hypothetical protein